MASEKSQNSKNIPVTGFQRKGVELWSLFGFGNLAFGIFPRAKAHFENDQE
jgi:hypothetical protein